MIIGARAHDFGRFSAEELAETIGRSGFQAVQLAPAKCLDSIRSIPEIREEHIGQLKTAMDAHHLRIAVYGSYVDLSCSDEDKRKQQVSYFLQAMQWNKEILRADTVGSESSYGRPSSFEKRLLFPAFLRSMDTLVNEAEKIGTDIAIEPVSWHVLSDIYTTAELLERFHSPRLKIILDLCNLLPRPDLIQQETYWNEVFGLLGPSIAIIHLKDICLDERRQQVQVPLGSGVCDYSVLRRFLAAHPDLPVLRENLKMETAKEDLEFMKGLAP